MSILIHVILCGLAAAINVHCTAVVDYNEHFKYLGTFTPTSQGSRIGIQSTRYIVYHASRSRASISEARFICARGFGGTLLAIESEEQHKFVVEVALRDALENVEIWTAGYYDFYSSSYLWETSGDFVSFFGGSSWGPYEPYYRDENFALAFKIARRTAQFEWSVRYDKEANYYICQVEY